MENQTPPQHRDTGRIRMLPPPPGTFKDREDLIRHVRDFGADQGYVVTIKKSRKDRRVILGCDRGGLYRNRRKLEENKRKRKACSRLINCPFEAIGRKEDDMWILALKNGEHNHEPLKDISEHPYSRRFSEEEVRQIKLMTEAGIKPRQVLKALKQSNPELQSTPRHLYNLKAKIRHGSISEKTFKSWRPNRSVPLATMAAETSSRHNYPLKVPNLIGGEFVESQSCAIIDVVNPATQEVVSQVPLSTYEELKSAVSSAKQAFLSWRNTPMITRQRIMFKLQDLIHRDIDKLVMNIIKEQGKTFRGAQGDVLRGLEVIEHACGLANLQMGEFFPCASTGIDTYYIREPLGVCAGICPYNFPAMISLWMFPIAVTCGNTFILKPSEKNPGASMILAALAMEAGLPKGVLNILHGTDVIVNHICDDDEIKAMSFVGSNAAGMHIFARAAARGKRVQSNMGAKNHAIIMPDANTDATLNAVVSSGFGAAGQRCMALNTAVYIGGSVPWEEELVKRAKALNVTAGTEPSADLGPVISKEAKDQIGKLVQNAVESGARLVLDGRDIMVPGFENGNFVGPTILCDVTSSMECCKEEIFGPVLLCMQADGLDDAITIVNRDKYANGASIFTTSGVAASKFQSEVETRMVGVNVTVPVPLPFPSFIGSKSSFAGDMIFCGRESVQFYTQIKTVAQQWKYLSHRLSLPVPPTYEADVTSRGASAALPSTSESDLPSRGVSPSLPSSHEDLPDYRMSLLMPTTCATDVAIPRVGFSVPSEANMDLPSPGVSTAVLPSHRKSPKSSVSGASLSTSAADKEDMPSQTVSLVLSRTSERICLPQTSQWTETLSPPPSQRAENIPSERIYVSQINETEAASTSEVYIPPAFLNVENVGPMSHRNNRVVLTSHRNDGIDLTSHRNDGIDLTSHRDTMHPTSERVYIPVVSHRNRNMSQAPERTENLAYNF